MASRMADVKTNLPASMEPIPRVDPTAELWRLARAVAEHFEETDAPLGVEARRLLNFYGR